MLRGPAPRASVIHRRMWFSLMHWLGHADVSSRRRVKSV